jgi:hypothetical protein
MVATTENYCEHHGEAFAGGIRVKSRNHSGLFIGATYSYGNHISSTSKPVPFYGTLRSEMAA